MNEISYSNIALFFSGRLFLQGTTNKIIQEQQNQFLELKKLYNIKYFANLNCTESDLTKQEKEFLDVLECTYICKPIITDKYMFDFPKAPETIVKNCYSQIINNYYCFEMIAEYQNKTNKKFDIICKFRSDIKINESLDLFKELNTNVVHIPIGNDWRQGFNDQIAYGDFTSMFVYCSQIFDLYNVLSAGVLLHPEILLQAHLQKNNVKIKRFSLDYHLLRK